ncbi:serine hydrolase domain-containing protein [Chitinophaga qingshengii]|uniref:Serine hydrolase n=1 Tax=Chitinophaga qingshengii TaxID=1569794 RepID=A0ABR7TFF2_9BACT|nr:serine hydrolase [Chitinophaga qingshengii]MBC9929063.1 serine hydrolase [Chitinophaga qingshengii]
MRWKILLLLPAFIITLSCTGQSLPDTAAVLTQNPWLHQLVVSVDGRTILNHTYNGQRADTLQNSQSLTKSILSVLIGIAIDKGYIKSVDQELVTWFPQLAQDPDPRKQHITLHQIMDQASGLWHENLEGGLGTYLSLPNPSQYVVEQPLLSKPGEVFHYNNAATHLLSVILTKASGMPTAAFARLFLFGPLDIQQWDWKKMNDGYDDGAGLRSVYLSTTAMNKIGTLLLQQGWYQGKTIVSEKWVRSILQPSLTRATNWGFTGSRYALCWYHVQYQGQPVTYGMGWGGQYLVILPRQKTVVAVHQAVNDATAIRQEQYFETRIFPLLWEYIQQQEKKAAGH